MPSGLERRLRRLERLNSERKAMEMVVKLSELERAFASVDVCLCHKAREPERAGYYARLKGWFEADRSRLLPFARALELACGANEPDEAIRRRVETAFGLEPCHKETPAD